MISTICDALDVNVSVDANSCVAAESVHLMVVVSVDDGVAEGVKVKRA